MASPPQQLTLIGLCDGDLDPNKYQSSYLTNKVGGQPDWSPVISRQSPRCGRCGAPLAHVVQVHCPLEASPYHRNLHLFACPGADCSGRSECWRALRSQCLETEVATAAAPSKPAPAQEAPLSASDWCDSADDWGMEEGDDVKQDGQVQEEAAAPGAEGNVERRGVGCVLLRTVVDTFEVKVKAALRFITTGEQEDEHKHNAKRPPCRGVPSNTLMGRLECAPHSEKGGTFRK